jgi:hypothetical protein
MHGGAAWLLLHRGTPWWHSCIVGLHGPWSVVLAVGKNGAIAWGYSMVSGPWYSWGYFVRGTARGCSMVRGTHGGTLWVALHDGTLWVARHGGTPWSMARGTRGRKTAVHDRS